MKRLFSSSLMCGIITLVLCFHSPAQTFTDAEALKSISKLEASSYSARKAEALRYAAINGIPAIIETHGGSFAEIQYIDNYGRPQYYTTENAVSAATISTNQVFTGGNAGLSLTGTGITVREWDAGAVRPTHQEFGGRVVQGDGVTALHYHSTHVAGSMIASGVVPDAKGMAPEAQLRAFDWNSDASEMAAEAANGALMSNHSYSYVRGWYYNGATWTWYGTPSISTQEDYLFGFYEAQAQLWDNIARNAPYYLICKSAGNDRNEGPTGGPYPKDGPYDCIAHAGIAKNVLTVGAVNDIPNGYTQPSDVVMTSFSSWGPADDGRIKPDIVANGVGLYSTNSDNDTDYISMSGTSMSTPSVTGSLALLQQHWNNLNPGTYMLAATLKALVIHTADEAGTSPGPDYQFGWGLMNTENAALKISEDQTLNVIDELVLNNGDTYTRTIQSDGTEPLKVTICWTDPAGTPASPQLDPLTTMLVNDLDLKLSRSASNYYPWKLNRNNPGNPATNNSENDVDNVEMVYMATPTDGLYTITVNHEGTLSGGSQAFSIIISGAVPTTLFPPSCTNPVSPAAGATNVPVNSSLSWQAASGATGYILYFGTNNPPTNLVNGSDLGNVTTYTPSPALNYSTTYYWKVIPYNADGQATGCSIWSFSTENNPYITLPYSESFETGFGQWVQAADDNFNWTRINGDTPTAKTSPTKAYSGSWYIYTEASSPRVPGQEAALEATFTFAGISWPELSIWYHMYGNQMGSVHVDVYNGSWTYNVWSIAGQQQTTDKAAYKNYIVNLSSFANQVGVKIRITGTIGFGERSDLSIDLVKVRQHGTNAPESHLPGMTEENMKTGTYLPVMTNEAETIEIFAFDRIVNIRNNAGNNIKGNISIFNIMGQLLQVIEVDGADAYKLDAGLKPGIYIVRLTSDNQVTTRKIIVY
jgi:subtilisin family serine protease